MKVHLVLPSGGFFCTSNKQVLGHQIFVVFATCVLKNFFSVAVIVLVDKNISGILDDSTVYWLRWFILNLSNSCEFFLEACAIVFIIFLEMVI